MFRFDRLETLIKERGIKASFLCAKAGKNRSYIVNAKNGNGSISAESCRIFADELGTSPEYLTGMTDDPSPRGIGHMVVPPSIAGDGAELMEILQRVNSDGRRSILEHARKIGADVRYSLGALGSIRKFLNPAAAGFSSPVINEDYIEIPRTAEVPEEADFCVTISGDSMEPYIHDGDTVYVKSTTDIAIGDAGLFIYNGEAYCKQLAVDFSGTVYLLSANPARRDANKKIPASEAASLVCCGKVLLGRRLPVPHYEW